MTYEELYKALDERFPTVFRAKWDNDGDMVCTDKSKEIRKVLIALDVNAPVIEKATKEGFDLIISHHPLIFSPMKRVHEDDLTSSRVLALIKSGVQVMSFHTRLDCVAVNEELAGALGLQDTESYDYDGVPMGRKGTLPREMTGDELASYIEEKLACPSVVFPGFSGKIRVLGVLGGGGMSSARDARAAGCDALLTGDYSYNSMLDMGEDGFPVFAAGHYYTEQPVCDYLYRTVKEIMPECECTVYQSITLKTR